ncbi:MAG: type I-C CRISPR-associated protein Cas5c [Eubacterium sp.]|jgi:CRISPR-associated protein Cas5d|nr:type I-C CRISPR-associated protein Cas5c [Eubacterium sp.]
MEKKRNTVEFKVYGKYALFSDPITRSGGEKLSYQTPTYQALKGIIESVYWKPTFIWRIDKVRVMNRIITESKGIRPIRMSGGNDLAYYTYLKDAEYQVMAHFEWNDQRPELSEDRNEHKHHNIAQRCICQGGRRDVFLGTRECQGYVEPCAFGDCESFYEKLPDGQDYGEVDFGIMFHGFDYPDETGKNELGVRLWRQVMKNGVIEFGDPRDAGMLCRTVREYGEKYSFKRFSCDKNFKIEEEGDFD